MFDDVNSQDDFFSDDSGEDYFGGGDSDNLFGDDSSGGLFDNTSEGMFNDSTNDDFTYFQEEYNTQSAYTRDIVAQYLMQIQYKYQNAVARGRMPRLTKQEIVAYLENYILNQTGLLPIKVERIEEFPDYLRHACWQCADVTYLYRNNFYIPEINYNIQYYFCSACCKLFIPRDIVPVYY